MVQQLEQLVELAEQLVKLAEVLAEILVELVAGGLGYCLQIQPVVPVVQARQGLGEMSRHLSRTEFAQTELMRTELIRTKLVQTELVQAELVQTELMRTELVVELIAELKVRAKIRQLKELKILLIAIYCQNSLKS